MIILVRIIAACLILFLLKDRVETIRLRRKVESMYKQKEEKETGEKNHE